MSLRNTRGGSERIGSWFLYALFLCVTPLLSFADSNFRQLSVDDGLAQSHVEAIVQDHEGYLWLGTAGGLSRYDGYHWKTFHRELADKTSLLADNISALHVDDKGRLWVGTDVGLSRYDARTESFAHWRHDPENPDSLAPGGVNTLASDSKGNIWIGSDGLTRLSPESGVISRYSVGNTLPGHVLAIHEDSSGQLWVGVGKFDDRTGMNKGLFRLEEKMGAFQRIQLGGEATSGNPSGDLSVTTIDEDATGRLWVGTWGGGIYQREKSSSSFLRQPLKDDDTGKYVRQVLSDPTGSVWIIISRQANWHDQSRQTELVHLGHEGAGLTYTASDASEVQTVLYLDRTGILWLGSSGSGIRLQDTRSGRFEHYHKDNSDGIVLNSDFVRAVHADSGGALWVGTPSGLNRIDRLAGTVTQYQPSPGDSALPGTVRVTALTRDGAGDLWVGTLRGLARMLDTPQQFEYFSNDPGDPASLSNDSIHALFTDSEDTLWVGTASGGINRFDRESHHFETFLNHTGTKWSSIVSFAEDSQQQLWVGTGLGLARIRLEDGLVTRYGVDLPVDEALQGVSINAIVESPGEPGVLWLGTGSRGLFRFDSRTGTVNRYSQADTALPNSTVLGIQVDDKGRLWISTQRGFCWFDPKTNSFFEYGLDRGLQSLEFNRNASHKGPDGQMYFGGVGGLNAFFPDQMVDNPFPPQVVVTSMSTMDRSDETGSLTPIHPADFPLGMVKLSSRQRDIRFEFSAIHFSNPGKNQLYYQLKGQDRVRQSSGSPGVASYTNLPYGKYTMEIQAVSPYGIRSGNPTNISFEIAQPFWTTAWFFTLCILVGFTLLLGAYQARIQVLRSRQLELQREVDSRTSDLQLLLGTVEQQAADLKELSEAKSRFVANVSHELRTPLTLLTAPLEDLKEGAFGGLSEKAQHEVDGLLRNASRLRRLVDQLLLISRLDAGKAQLKLQCEDIVRFIQDVATEFAPAAEHQGVTLRTSTPDSAVLVYFDANLIMQVLSNLLGNAFKYTPAGGQILLQLRHEPDEQRIFLDVKDNGEGIAPEHLPHVFERFYRGEQAGNEARPGTGIGLSVVQELVEIHKGTVSVKSETGVGSVFTVSLNTATDADQPGEVRVVMDDHVLSESVPMETRIDEFDEAGPSTEYPEDRDLALVLIVDDNAEIRRLLRRQLRDSYRVIEAADGVEGLELARRSLPDVIVSDVLMPRMDGESLCRAIKADPALDFIPVVLLTAKSGLDDKLSGLETGADEYLSKPFDKRELRARLRNLIETRHRLKHLAGKQGVELIPASPVKNQDVVDSRFMQRVQSAISTNLSRDDFSVEQLADLVHTSRIHLYRRLRELCGKTPSELIMSTRLKVATELLGKQAGSISEIAYGVGFKSVSHFARRFRKEFNESPSEYRTKSVERTDG